MKLLLSLSLACILVAGCGQKGPLYKTPANAANQAQQPVNNAPKPSL
ncbi:lipoprotein [Shewanella avicenniae]|uniref:Lipoprotein n=1 Tax=Shewanella avicenniae TaxID=2814294 RepID=A0ABX7QT16_9GAMM|nr:lipoprotein [Shewanella avicenniae]